METAALSTTFIARVSPNKKCQHLCTVFISFFVAYCDLGEKIRTEFVSSCVFTCAIF